MLEYRVLTAAMHDFRSMLTAQAVPDPAEARVRDEHVQSLVDEETSGVLGSLLDPVVWFATVGEQEASLVSDIADVWREGVGIYRVVEAYRSSLDAIMTGAADSATVAEFNAAAAAVGALGTRVQTNLARLDELRRRVAAHEHLPPHPRQEDRGIESWTWSDLLLGRRTDALVRELMQRAQGPRQQAFALGACAGYGAHVSGNMYIGQVVGGPRRSHRVRNRIARNSVGSWIAKQRPDVPASGVLADRLEVLITEGTAAELTGLLSDALGAVFPAQDWPALDPAVGVSRLITHLRDLDAIRVPDQPAGLPDSVITAVFGDPAAPYQPTLADPTWLTESGGTPGHPASGGGVQIQSYPGNDPTIMEEPESSENKCENFWKAVGMTFAFLIITHVVCIIEWAGGRRCHYWDDLGAAWTDATADETWEAEFDTDVGTAQLTVEQAAALGQRPEVWQLAADLFTLQSTMWEGFQKAAEFLALHGVTYPDEYLDRWRYRQFTVIPQSEPESWPQLSDDGGRFDLYPTTGLESPHGIAPFAAGATPAAVLTGLGGGGQLAATSISTSLWWQVVQGVADSTNYDLEADRGWRHPCWRTGGSITDQPVDVIPLDYSEI